MATYYHVDPASGDYIPITSTMQNAAIAQSVAANKGVPSGMGIVSEEAALQINQERANNPFYVDADNSNSQGVYSELIKNRQQWMDETIKPYEDALFAGMSYDNPNLATDAFNTAIPNIQRNYSDAQGVTDRAMQSAGMSFDPTEQKLNARLGKLKQQETISKTANTIRQRLKERDLNTALGAGTPTVTTQQG